MAWGDADYEGPVIATDPTQQAKPYFYGINPALTVEPRVQAEVPMTVVMGNSIVRLEFTRNFESYFENGGEFEITTWTESDDDVATVAEGDSTEGGATGDTTNGEGGESTEGGENVEEEAPVGPQPDSRFKVVFPRKNANPAEGKYEEAKEMLASAFETDYWSKAFAEQRKDVIAKYMLPIVIGIIVVLSLFFKFLGWAKKKNKATSLKVGRKTYLEELIYAFHLVFHPFDGFWDLKHEKRGSVRAASTIIGLTMLSFVYQSIGQGYTFNPRSAYTTVFVQVLSIGVPVILWTVSNWCLTTLFDGEGSFKDIYIATGYSLAPLPLFVVISTVLTNVLSASEGSIPTMLITIAFVWVVILIFFGTLVTHDYTLNKNFITILGTIVAAAIIMFVSILFSSLVVKMVAFLISLITEIGNRIL